MKRAEKARRIGRILDELYPAVPIPLQHRDPFTLLVAVLLSAQCTDVRVNQVTPALFARAPDPSSMAALDLDELRSIIRPCGLAPQKSRALSELSRLLLERHGGAVPSDLEALEALPGVGHKTASVVLVQAFHVPAFPVDTHIQRLAVRWGLSPGPGVERVERDLKALFPIEEWARRHLQIIVFGRERCPARGHVLSRCPICSWAASRKRMKVEHAQLSRAVREELAAEARAASAQRSARAASSAVAHAARKEKPPIGPSKSRSSPQT